MKITLDLACDPAAVTRIVRVLRAVRDHAVDLDAVVLSDFDSDVLDEADTSGADFDAMCRDQGADPSLADQIIDQLDEAAHALATRAA